jgi:hypothetical protein
MAYLLGTDRAEAQSQGDAVKAHQTGSFLAKKPGSLQDLTIVQDHVYALTRDLKSGRFSVACSSLGGSQAWVYDLPPGFYLSLGVEENEAVVLHSVGYLQTQAQHIIALDPTSGSTNVVREVPAGKRLIYTGHNTFVRNGDGGLDVVRISGPQIDVQRVPNVSGPLRSLAVAHRDSAGSYLVEVYMCRVLILNTLGEARELTVDSAEIRKSLSFNQNIERMHAADPNAAIPQVVTATGCAGSSLFLMLSPYSIDLRANVVVYDATTGSSSATSIVLPSLAKVGGPVKIARSDQDLYLLFSSGSYAVYSI